MQQSTLSLEGLGTLYQVLSEDKRAQLKADLQGVIDRYHRVYMQDIVNAAMMAIQQQQAMKNHEREVEQVNEYIQADGRQQQGIQGENTDYGEVME